MGNKVLVTGAGGFIGSHLAELLLENGFQVKAFIRYNSRNDWGWLEESKYKDQIDKDERDFYFTNKKAFNNSETLIDSIKSNPRFVFWGIIKNSTHIAPIILNKFNLRNFFPSCKNRSVMPTAAPNTPPGLLRKSNISPSIGVGLNFFNLYIALFKSFVEFD